MAGRGPEGEARDEAIALTTAEFQALREVLRQHAGIRFDDDTAFLLQRRLQTRLRELSLARFQDYVDHLRDARLPAAKLQAELQALCERVVTRETYFFREHYQLDALREEILPGLLRRHPGQPLSLWSAGCSTGEEAYTLAISATLASATDQGLISVLGTDLSLESLTVAQAGVYGPSSFRQTDDALRARFFHPDPAAPKRWQVNDEVRRLCMFRWLNLNQDDFSAAGGPHAVILCRNVLIYMDRSRRPAIIERLRQRLMPGGYLLLGHSEALLDRLDGDDSGLTLCNLKHAQVYRRSEDTRP